MLCDIVIGRTRQQSMPLAMLTMTKSCMGFYFYALTWLCSYSYCAPLGSPLGRRSSAMKINEHYDNRLGFYTFIFFEPVEAEGKISSLAVLATLLTVVQHPVGILLALAD